MARTSATAHRWRGGEVVSVGRSSRAGYDPAETRTSRQSGCSPESDVADQWWLYKLKFGEVGRFDTGVRLVGADPESVAPRYALRLAARCSTPVSTARSTDGTRKRDCRGVRVKARTYAEEQAGSDDEDRARRRISARGVGEVGKAVRAHALRERDRGEKLILRCSHTLGAGGGNESRACLAGGFECGGLRIDPGARKIDTAASCGGVRKTWHAVCAHAVREGKRT